MNVHRASDGLLIRDLGPSREEFLRDVVEGLGKSPKELYAKYFYDERGSQLFDEITALPEYYPTRTETGILEVHIDDIVATLGKRVLLIEYGSGSSTKTLILLRHILEPAGYVPVDISRAHLLKTSRSLEERFPRIPILPVVADYTDHVLIPDPPGDVGRRVVYFPGSTIGNFDPEAARIFLDHIADVAGEQGGLLIGVDVKKDRDVLEAAYNDAADITAEFNLNLLLRINHELDGDFDLDRFEHVAFYNEDRGRIEMHLRSLNDQTVAVADRKFRFRAGETIHTESSHKYTVSEFATLAGSRFRQEKVWTDARGWFSVQYFRVLR
jgi:dimethylhistidine N-methyltransferase